MPGPARVERPRSGLDLSVLGVAPLRRLLTAQWASVSGDFAMIAALPFVVYSLGGGSTEVGLAFAVGAGSLVVLVLFGGVLADRHGRLRVLFLAESMRVLTQGALAALLLSGGARFWHVIVAEVSIGAGASLAQPALTGLVAEIVPPGRLQGANALRAMLASMAMLTGPALAGAAMAVAGPGAAVALDAVSYAVSAALLVGLTPTGGRAARAVAGRAAPFLAELRAGWAEFARRRWLWVMIGSFATVNMFVFGPFEVLGAETAHASLGGAGAWSAILAAFGLGSAAGGLVALIWVPDHPLRATACLLLVWVPLLAAIAAVAPLGAILAAAALTGAGWLLLTAIWEATLQARIPGERLSRVVSYDWLGSNALLPLGLFLAAPVGAALGTRTALLVSACVAILVTAVALSVPGVRRMPGVTATREQDEARGDPRPAREGHLTA